MPCHLAALPPSGSRCRAQNPFNWHSALVLTVSVTATRAIPPVPAPSGAPAMPSPPQPPRCAPRCQRRCPLPLCFSLWQYALSYSGGTGDCGAAGGLGIDCRYPYSLIVLNVECANYKIQEENCQSNCKKYLSRWPILKVGHIRYQVIIFEG